MDPLILLRSQIFIVLYPSLSFHKFLDLLMIVIMMSMFLLNKGIQYKHYIIINIIVLKAGLHKNNRDTLDRHRNIPNSPQRAGCALGLLNSQVCFKILSFSVQIVAHCYTLLLMFGVILSISEREK